VKKPDLRFHKSGQIVEAAGMPAAKLEHVVMCFPAVAYGIRIIVTLCDFPPKLDIARLETRHFEVIFPITTRGGGEPEKRVQLFMGRVSLLGCKGSWLVALPASVSQSRMISFFPSEGYLVLGLGILMIINRLDGLLALVWRAIELNP
jgi:hypothetical protein